MNGFGDVLRFFICVNCGIIVTLSVLIIIHYVKILSMGYHGVVPWHITLLGTSYTLFVIGFGIDLLSRLGTDDLTYRIVVGLLAALFGDAGLGLIYYRVYSNTVASPVGWNLDKRGVAKVTKFKTKKRNIKK